MGFLLRTLFTLSSLVTWGEGATYVDLAQALPRSRPPDPDRCGEEQIRTAVVPDCWHELMAVPSLGWLDVHAGSRPPIDRMANVPTDDNDVINRLTATNVLIYQLKIICTSGYAS